MKIHRMKILSVVLLSLCLSNSAYPQLSIKESPYHPYHVNYWVTGSILSVGMLTNYLGIAQITNKNEITLSEIQELKKDKVNGFDRWVFDLDPANAGKFGDYSDYALMSSIVLPVTLLFDKQIRSDWLDVLLIYLETMSLTTNIYEWSFLGPNFQDRIRPVAYFEQLSYNERNSGNNRNSFYSGHVASITASTFFMAKVYSDYHPEIGNNKYFLYGVALIPPLVAGYFRIKALKHFPSDVAVGIGVGVLCAIIIPELHRANGNIFSMEIYSAPETAGLAIKWQPGFLK